MEEEKKDTGITQKDVREIEEALEAWHRWNRETDRFYPNSSDWDRIARRRWYVNRW